jgi:radical SAM/Cys-rich protein
MDTAGSEFQANAAELRAMGKARLSLQERKRRRRALDALGVPEFSDFLEQKHGVPAPLPKREVTTLQLNVGLHCNQACTHCHVESSPRRKEAMSMETVEHVLRVLEASPSVTTVDITGGAPEMSAAFWPLVRGARALGREVIDRCNLTVLFEPGMEALPQFLAEQHVRVVASLPCYSQRNVDTQRGSKVFERSVAGLRLLNAAGFGQPGSPLKLDLVYNPSGAFLPPSQGMLRAKYAEELHANFGIAFNELFTITNMPIKRFADHLYKSNELEKYMQLLVDNFNPATIPETMCRSLVSVSWDGKLYDCDFNMALEIESPRGSIFEIDSLSELEQAPIGLGNHCFGCTAGAGSS